MQTRKSNKKKYQPKYSYNSNKLNNKYYINNIDCILKKHNFASLLSVNAIKIEPSSYGNPILLGLF